MSLFESRQVIDVSRMMTPGGINNTYDTQRELEVDPIVFKMDGLADSRMSIVKIHSHIGTHIEMPTHRFSEMMDIAQCPLDVFYGSVRLADVTFAGQETELTVEHICQATEDDVQPGDTVIIYSTFEPEKRPIITLPVIDWLIDHEVKVVGFDSMAGITNEAHDRVLSANIPLLEELVNLESVPAKRGTIIALPINVKGLDSFPVRALIVC